MDFCMALAIIAIFKLYEIYPCILQIYNGKLVDERAHIRMLKKKL